MSSDLKNSLNCIRHMFLISGDDLEEELLEVEKVRSVVESWISSLEVQMKNAIESMFYHIEKANATEKSPAQNGRAPDFSSVSLTL